MTKLSKHKPSAALKKKTNLAQHFAKPMFALGFVCFCVLGAFLYGWRSAEQSLR